MGCRGKLSNFLIPLLPACSPYAVLNFVVFIFSKFVVLLRQGITMKPNPYQQNLSIHIFLALLFIAVLSSCSEEINTEKQLQNSARPSQWQPPKSALAQRNFQLINANWVAATKVLKVKGTSNNNSERIRILNTASATQIASTISSSNGNWEIEIQSPDPVPCRISVVSESGTIQSDVDNTPANCNIATNTAPASNTINAVTYPEAIIDEPETDLSIAVNQSVNFAATANNITGTPMYNWSFSGAVPQSSVQNPGKITFTKAGVYYVSLDVTDSRGLTDPTPAKRTITVFDSVSALTAQPIANIDTPMGDQTIMVGDSLNFSGSGNDPASNETVTFLWDFAGVVPNSASQNPGNVTFNSPGTFTIVLSVSDAAGNIGQSQVTVTVIDPSASNQPPVGMITSPATDIIINPGDSILVEGNAADPDGNTPVTFLWAFDGVMPDLTMQNPGTIIYPNPGVYTITLTATDSLGLSDPNPPTRVITVQAPGPISSDTPNGEILTPAMDTTIMAGESINFTATGTAPPGNEPLMFLWSFDGVAPNSTNMDAGPIVFPDPGVFTVTLLVVDATNQVDPTPATVVITVQDPGSGSTPPPMSSTMVSHIIMPDTDVTIMPGDAVSFTGFVDPEINPPYTYLWLFDGAAKNSDNLIPGEVVFDTPGNYNVMFFAIDADGMFDSRPATRTITAVDTAVPDPGPIPSIVNPAGDMTITTGDTITFEGSVIDVSGNNTLEYLWTFDGAAPDDMNLDPAPVTFDMAGVYEVTFSATDTTTMISSGQPAIVIITVEDPAPTPTPAGPVAEIVSPAGDLNITVGDTVDFEGNAVDTSGNNMLEFLWTFDGAAADSTNLSPGPIVFDMPGQFNIVFNVTDTSDGSSANATVAINVMPANGPPPAPVAELPQGIIVEPVGDQTINVGGTLQFVGDGINPIDNDPLNYAWDFGNGSTSTAQTPGIVTFNQVGVFTVTLTVNHDEVDFDPTPAEITVTVVDATDPPP